MFNFKKKKEVQVYTPVTGDVIELTDLKDPVFSRKMMGDGFAVEPVDGQIYSPVAGTITSIFPTKHAITIKTREGLEVLVHIGIDTVELNGEGFEVNVSENQKVTNATKIAEIDLNLLQARGKEKKIIVVFPEYQGVSLNFDLGYKSSNSLIGTVMESA